MKPSDLLATCDHLLGGARRGRRRQSDLKRAVSTAYYALFHAMCRNAADQLIGATRSSRPQRAWVQTYRAVEHGMAKAQCQRRVMEEFPKEIQDFAALFVELQGARHRADYDPTSSFTASEARTLVQRAAKAIRDFAKAAQRDRRAFAAFVVLKLRR